MPIRPTAPLCLFALLGAPFAQAIDSRDPSDGQWQAYAAHAQLERSSTLNGLKWRALGPTVQGGRVLDVESIPGEAYGFYVAYASGGVWKTTNNGVSFEPLSDGLPTMITGDIAVDPNRPQRHRQRAQTAVRNGLVHHDRGRDERLQGCLG